MTRTFPSEPAAARFCALFQDAAAFTALRMRHGGYVSDLVALRDKYLAAEAAGAGTPAICEKAAHAWTSDPHADPRVAACHAPSGVGCHLELQLLLRTKAAALCATDAPAHLLAVKDASAVASLAGASSLYEMLHELSLPPEHVATVFDAILRRGVSPRGAVPLDSSLGVPL